MDKAASLQEDCIFAVEAPSPWCASMTDPGKEDLRPDSSSEYRWALSMWFRPKDLILSLQDTPYIVARKKRRKQHGSCYLQCADLTSLRGGGRKAASANLQGKNIRSTEAPPPGQSETGASVCAKRQKSRLAAALQDGVRKNETSSRSRRRCFRRRSSSTAG